MLSSFEPYHRGMRKIILKISVKFCSRVLEKLCQWKYLHYHPFWSNCFGDVLRKSKMNQMCSIQTNLSQSKQCSGNRELNFILFEEKSCIQPATAQQPKAEHQRGWKLILRNYRMWVKNFYFSQIVFNSIDFDLILMRK